MKRFFYIALSALLFWTCGEEFQPANPLDPDAPDYVPPEVIFVDSINDGDTLETETVTFGWTGNELVTAYRYKLDYNDWSVWTTDTMTTFDYLDEGNHNVSIQSRYPSGDTSFVARISFVIDAVTGPALMFYPLRHITSAGETVTFQILAEEVVNLTAVEFTVEFDPTVLQVTSLTQGNLFQSNGESVFFEDVDNQQGTIKISSGLLGGVSPSINGTGDIAILEVQAIKQGQSALTFDGSEVLRAPDNSDIVINETIGAILEAR